MDCHIQNMIHRVEEVCQDDGREGGLMESYLTMWGGWWVGGLCLCTVT